jgi:hypothetical protein
MPQYAQPIQKLIDLVDAVIQPLLKIVRGGSVE